MKSPACHEVDALLALVLIVNAIFSLCYAVARSTNGAIHVLRFIHARKASFALQPTRRLSRFHPEHCLGLIYFTPEHLPMQCGEAKTKWTRPPTLLVR